MENYPGNNPISIHDIIDAILDANSSRKMSGIKNKILLYLYNNEITYASRNEQA